MKYKNTDHGDVDFGFGPFILNYEGPNEDGTQEWVVRIHQSKLLNNEKIYFTILSAIEIDIKPHLMYILGVSRIDRSRSQLRRYWGDYCSIVWSRCDIHVLYRGSFLRRKGN